MKIYLAGPMRGIPNFNFPAFDFAAEKLREEGHEVFSPADNDRKEIGEESLINERGDENELAAKTGYTIRKALATDLRWICNHADAVALLRGWRNSSGATAEAATANALGLTIIELGKDYHNG